MSVCCAAVAAAGLALTACGGDKGDATAGLKPTEGLRYIPAPDGEEGYWVSGMGAAEVSELVIPSTYLDEPVTGIKASAFRGNEDLMSVAIPSSVKTIGEMAFYECGLLKAEFSEGLEEIGERAFSSCDMSEIDLPESLKTIGEYAFAYCDSLKEITIPAGVVSIGEGSLHCEALETITVAEGNESYYIEGGCLIERETKTLLHGGEKNAIPDGVVTLGGLTFSGSLAESISLPDSVMTIMADEAHRGQYGLEEKVDSKTGKIIVGTARIIRNSLPNATYIGFTGTPISLKDRNTREVFGDYIDVYDMTQSVEDGATRPVYYESRVIKLHLDEETLKRIDAEYEVMANNAEPEVVEKSKRELGQMEALLGNDATIDSLVKDITKIICRIL